MKTLLQSIQEQRAVVNVNDLTNEKLANLYYPISSCLFTTSPNVDPNIFIGGSWSKVPDDYYIYGGNKYEKHGTQEVKQTTGSTGSTALSDNQIPSHTHSYSMSRRMGTGSGSCLHLFPSGSTPLTTVYSSTDGQGGGHTHKLGTHIHDIDVPTFTVNAWIRNGLNYNSSGNAFNLDQAIKSMFPIGSIYILLTDTIDPSILIGGQWERIQGTYYLKTTNKDSEIVQGDSFISTASTGTTESISLSSQHCPPHKHGLSAGANRPVGTVVRTYVDPSSSYYSDKATLSYAGNTYGHNHTLNSHTHNYEPSFCNVALYRRLA